MLNLFGNHNLIEGDYNLTDIRVMEEIGRGNSHVYKVMLKNNIYALKQIEVKTDYEYQNFHNEISYMRDLSQVSPFMIKYIGYFVTNHQINQYSKRKYAHIIMECAQMNLQHLIAYRYSEGQRFTKEEILNITGFLLQAFVDLQKNKIAHCDIKPQNILVVNSQTLAMKLCDVGSCKVVSSEQIEQATIFGTVPFLAPELLKKKSKKIISSNPFKSDVFSLGLVLLYLITNKKFSSKERIQICEGAYDEVIHEWIKEARQLTNYDSRISEVLKYCLEFEQFKRPLFTGVMAIFQGEKKKKKVAHENKMKKLDLQQQQKRAKIEENFTSVPTNKISLFKRAANLTTKMSNRTTSYAFPKINTKNLSRGVSPSPNTNSPTISPLSKRQSSCFSSSPQRINSSVIDFKKIIYVTEEEKDFIPYQYLPQEEKNFVLFTSYVGFKKADCVSIFPSCSLQAIYELGEVEANKLYLQYKGVQGIGVAEDVPTLGMKKIYANLSNTSLIGGYKYLFRSFCGDQLESLDLNITGSDAVFNEVYDLLDMLGLCKNLKTFSLSWESLIMSPEQHFVFNQKVSKLPIKKLIIIMNENFIKYQKQNRWLLPKNCENLYLEFQNNFLGKIITNLSLSITKTPIKQLYLNLSNNNISKSEANFIFKSVASMETLQKLVLNLSWNPIDDLSYMLTEFQKLKGLTLLELKIYHCNISEQKILQAISELKYLFDKKMKILKVGYDRNMRKKQFQDRIQAHMEPFKNLKIDVIGNDNKYFMAFIKKKDKSVKPKGTAATNRIKGQKPSLGYKSITPDQKIPKAQNKAGFCQAFICNNQNFENYVCLSCSDFSELSKTQYVCKYCIENCRHKGHNFVKIYEKKRCNCAYSGLCSTQVSRKLCAEELNMTIKQQFECLRCEKLICGGCVTKCLQMHKDWVQISKEPLYFKCGTKI